MVSNDSLKAGGYGHKALSPDSVSQHGNFHLPLKGDPLPWFSLALCPGSPSSTTSMWVQHEVHGDGNAVPALSCQVLSLFLSGLRWGGRGLSSICSRSGSGDVFTPAPLSKKQRITKTAWEDTAAFPPLFLSPSGNCSPLCNNSANYKFLYLLRPASQSLGAAGTPTPPADGRQQGTGFQLE